MPLVTERSRSSRDAGSSRVPLWDNARFVCVTLVVIGHGIQRLTYDSDAALSLYLIIYSFHMPAFALISGYFSSADEPTRKRMTRVLTDILLPYAIMETLWSITKWLTHGHADFNPTQPSWTLWFLLALGIFRMILPYLALLRFPLALAVIASVGVGYLDNVDSTFSLSRTIGILPFFVLGWRLRSLPLAERWLSVGGTRWWTRLGAAGVFAVWTLVVVSYIDVWRAGELRFWFFFDEPYRELIGSVPWWAGAVRLGVLALATLLVAAFLVLMPRGQSRLSEFGRATMYVYLLHSFALYPLRESGVLRLGHESFSALSLMVIACIAISIVLASEPVRRLFRPLIEPRAAWLLARGEPSLPSVSTPIDRDASRT